MEERATYLGIGFRLRRKPVNTPHFAEHRTEGKRKSRRQDPSSSLTNLHREGGAREKEDVIKS
jgi:hypothetical protein